MASQTTDCGNTVAGRPNRILQRTWGGVRGGSRLRSPLSGCSFSGDSGMSTAEYAIGTVAAAAFAALLYSVITGGSITGALTSLIQRALETSL